jgi:thiamine-phosphate diphosphorylase
MNGFYAVLDADSEELARVLVSRDGAGARVLQLRWKPEPAVSTRDLLAAARMARRVTREHGALFVVDDRIDVALAVEADGVHLGQEDLPLADARAIAAGRLRIGISTHDVDQVRAAVAGGADYLGFGPVYETASKRNPDPVKGIAGLRAAVAAAGGVPVIAIGGITVERVKEVAEAGAAGACVIAAVNRSADPAAAGRAIDAAFATAGRPWRPSPSS